MTALKTASDTRNSQSHESRRRLGSVEREKRGGTSERALRNAFLELLESRHVDEITIADIAARAGVHRATFFRHHLNKESLLGEIAAEQVRALSALTVPTFDEVGAEASVLRLCAYVHENRRLWTALLTGGAAGAMRDEHQRIAAGLAVERAAPDTWLPAELGIECATHNVFSTLAWWLRQPEGAVGIAAAADILHRLLGTIFSTRRVPGSLPTE